MVDRRAVNPSAWLLERMNSPLGIREIRLRGLRSTDGAAGEGCGVPGLRWRGGGATLSLSAPALGIGLPMCSFLPRRSLRMAALALIAAAAPSGAQEAGAWVTPGCPVPEGMQGYPVWAREVNAAPLDSAFLWSLADAVARRWEPPSPRRRGIRGLDRLHDRLQPPEPRWPDDWTPDPRHVARLEVTLRRRGRHGEPRVFAVSGDPAFDRTLPEIFRGGAPGGPELPILPAGLDSVRVVVGFGASPEKEAQVVRFAVQQTPVRVVPGTLNVARPRAGGGAPASATAKYEVDSHGSVSPGSIEFVESSDREMEGAVRAGLRRARFTPAQSNCRAIPLSVVQVFGNL
jgi:hypothetical protein